MALTGIRGEVTQTKVAGLLEQRSVAIVESDDPDDVERFEARVAGAAVEVVLLVGADPSPSLARELAVEAIALQTASEIEYAEFPEQQSAGDVGRGYQLHRRYLELLARLEAYVAGGAPGEGPSVGALSPQGDFPPAAAYPDPVERSTERSTPCSW